MYVQCAQGRYLRSGYYNGSGKLQQLKDTLDAFFRDMPKSDYVVTAPEHEKRAIYTGMLNLYTAYHREKISFKEIFARGDVYGFKTPLEFATFASNLGLGGIALCCNSGGDGEKMLEQAMTSAILFVTK
jgi:hypothetical protein